MYTQSCYEHFGIGYPLGTFKDSGKRKHYCRIKFRCCLAIYLILPVSFPVWMPWSLCYIYMRDGIPREKLNAHTQPSCGDMSFKGLPTLSIRSIFIEAICYMSKGVSKSTYVQTANKNVFISCTPMHLYLLLYHKMSRQLLFVCFGEIVRWSHIAMTGPSSCCVAEASTEFQITFLLPPNWWITGTKLSFVTTLLKVKLTKPTMS